MVEEDRKINMDDSVDTSLTSEVVALFADFWQAELCF